MSSEYQAVGKSVSSSPPAMAAVGQLPRVLVIEDEAAVAEGVRLLLCQDYQVEIAPSARHALESIGAGRDYDVLLCDLMMPGMNGMQFFERLSTDFPGVEQRIIFMTGGAFTSEAEEFLDSVDNPQLEKPFDYQRIDQLLRSAVGRGRGFA